MDRTEAVVGCLVLSTIGAVLAAILVLLPLGFMYEFALAPMYSVRRSLTVGMPCDEACEQMRAFAIQHRRSEFVTKETPCRDIYGFSIDDIGKTYCGVSHEDLTDTRIVAALCGHDGRVERIDEILD